MSETQECPFCAEEIKGAAVKCKHCGEFLAEALPSSGVRCSDCRTPLRADSAFCPGCGMLVTDSPGPARSGTTTSTYNAKSKLVTALLAILLGGLGIHKFYLGQALWGVLYLLFCWTFIPAIVGLIEGIRFLLLEDSEFDERFNK